MVARRRRTPPRWVRSLLAIQDRFRQIGGDVLSKAVTFALFVSLLPAVVVAIAVIGILAGSRPTFAADLVERLGLTGSSADLFTQAIDNALDAKAVTSVVGLALLAWTALGLATTMKEVCDKTWQLNERSLRARIRGLVWLVGSVILVGASVYLSALVPNEPPWLAPVLLVLGYVSSILLFLWTFAALTALRLPLRAHLPGAIAGGLVFHILTALGTTLLPPRIASSTALFGTLGVIFAILFWFLLIGRIIVYASAFNVVLWERRHGTVDVPIAVPRWGGDADEVQEATFAERSGTVPALSLSGSRSSRAADPSTTS